jgi:uncharacterized protein YoxC
MLWAILIIGILGLLVGLYAISALHDDVVDTQKMIGDLYQRQQALREVVDEVVETVNSLCVKVGDTAESVERIESMGSEAFERYGVGNYENYPGLPNGPLKSAP